MEAVRYLGSDIVLQDLIIKEHSVKGTRDSSILCLADACESQKKKFNQKKEKT